MLVPTRIGNAKRLRQTPRVGKDLEGDQYVILSARSAHAQQSGGLLVVEGSHSSGTEIIAVNPRIDGQTFGDKACHPERSEGSRLWPTRSLLSIPRIDGRNRFALRMTARTFLKLAYRSLISKCLIDGRNRFARCAQDDKTDFGC